MFQLWLFQGNSFYVEVVPNIAVPKFVWYPTQFGSSKHYAVELYECIPMKPTVLFVEVTENFLDKHLEIMDGFTNSFIFTCVLNTLKHYSKTEKYFFY